VKSEIKKRRICLDAGHYGKKNVCPAIPEYYESARMWSLHLLLKQHLEAYGLEVIITREDQNEDKALTQRGKMAAGCDLFVSLHSNATANYQMNEAVDYVVAIVALNGSTDEIGEKLAAVVAQTMGVTQRSRISKRYYDDQNKELDYYGVIRGAVSVGVPAMILEHSFHTNTRIVQWLLDDENLDKLAQAEARQIADHLGIYTQEPLITIEKLEGYLKVIYAGADGVNVHNTPDFEEISVNNEYGPVGPTTMNGSEFSVTGIVTLGDGSQMYRLLSGLFITAAEKYVEFNPTNENEAYIPWALKVVNTEVLNVRETPNGRVIGELQAVTVIGEEPDSDGDVWYKVHSGDLVGYVWPEYVSE